MSGQRRNREFEECFLCCKNTCENIKYVSTFNIESNCYIDIPLCDECIGDFTKHYICTGQCSCVISGLLGDEPVYLIVPGARHDSNPEREPCSLERFVAIYES